MLNTCSPSSYADTNTNGQRTSWLWTRSCQSAVHAPIGRLTVCTFPVKPVLQVEDAERGVLVFGLGDRVLAVGVGREGVAELDAGGSRDRRDELGLVDVGDVVDVIAAAPGPVEFVLVGGGVVGQVEVVIAEIGRTGS